MLLSLPNDLIQFIFCYLDLPSIYRLSQVNKAIANILTSESWWQKYVSWQGSGDGSAILYPPRIQLYYQKNTIKPGYERFLPLYVCLCRAIFWQRSCQDYFWQLLLKPPSMIKQHAETFFSRWACYQSMTIRDLLHYLSTEGCWEGYYNLLSRLKLALQQKDLVWQIEDHTNLLIYSGIYEIHFPLKNANIIRSYPISLLRSIVFSPSTQLNIDAMFRLIQKQNKNFLDSKRTYLFRIAALVNPGIRLIQQCYQQPNSPYPSNLYNSQLGEILNCFTYYLDTQEGQYKRWIIKQDISRLLDFQDSPNLDSLKFTPEQLNFVKTWLKWIRNLPSHPKNLLIPN